MAKPPAIGPPGAASPRRHEVTVSLRFEGGPLDGRDLTAATPAEEYRMPGGVYRPATGDLPMALADALAAYRWLPEQPVSWHESPLARPQR
jgi:hypothetical protein